MAAELLRRGVHDHRRALVGWCLGVAAYVAVLAAIFPSIEGSPGFSELLQSYPEAFKSLFGLAGGVDITTGAGFVDGEFFSLMLPLLAIALAIGSGARTRRLPDRRPPRSRLLARSAPLRLQLLVGGPGAALERRRMVASRSGRRCGSRRPRRGRSVDRAPRPRIGLSASV